MKTEQLKWNGSRGWSPLAPPSLGESAQLVLVFGATAALHIPGLVRQIREFYPAAVIAGCSTAGEICGTEVSDDAIVITAVQFEHTQIHRKDYGLSEPAESERAGASLSRDLPPSLRHPVSGEPERLMHVFVLSDGLNVNGSDLVRGLKLHLPADVTVTGGLAGDGANFRETLVFRGDQPEKNTITALGFYGQRLRVGYGSLGGWDPFGPERLVTEAKGNVLYKLDGQSALALYKKYLGDHANGLPGTGLLFPLSVRATEGETPVVRTLLAVDEKEQSMTFAGDVPVGSHARLMKANFDRLIDGAVGAARACQQSLAPDATALAILISCVGRKLVLKQRIEEEVEGVRTVLGDSTTLAGFYSYGEISPFVHGTRCELHNQTMTITTLQEF